MKRALFISRYFPTGERQVHGTFKRMDVHMEALDRVCDEIRCLFLLPVADGARLTAEAVAEHQERLRRRWSSKVVLELEAVIGEGPADNPWAQYGRGIFDFHSLQMTLAYGRKPVTAVIRRALDSAPDLIFAHRLNVMSALLRIGRDLPASPVFLDMDDVEHKALLRRLLHGPGWPMERLKLLQLPSMMWGERCAIRRATSTFVCSEVDRRHLQRTLGVKAVETVHNSIEIPAAAHAGGEKPWVIFVGTFEYRPNVLAADFLVRNIWPLVREAVPDARLFIIGNRQERCATQGAPGPGAVFTGFVDDLAGMYREARVVCCPIYYGSGTRVKIIEAAAHGKAVVSTPLGAEGLDFEDGKEILLAANARELAAHCIALLRDAGRAERIGSAARAKAIASYDRASIRDQLAATFLRALGRARSSQGKAQS